MVRPVKVGSIIKHPNKNKGQPYIKDCDVGVLEVIKKLQDGLSYGEIYDQFNGRITIDQIADCNLWRARFLPETLRHTFNQVSDQNMIMLDENLSHRMLPALVRAFGRTSHVRFDGLVNKFNDDRADIWAHLVENNYRAIITADDDFIQISRNYRKRMREEFGNIAACTEPVPIVILMRTNVPQKNCRDLLKKHKNDIMQFIANNNAVYASITEKGFDKHEPDPPPTVPNEWLAKLRRWQTGRHSGPS